jgi:N-acetyl-gamma-glutamyl-phosphate reductase
MEKIKAGIIGGAGYTGGELIRLLLRHPFVELTFVHSESNSGKPFHTVHRDLLGDTGMTFTGDFDDSGIDVLFLCSGHGHSKRFFDNQPVKKSLKIIDLSQDFRLDGHYFRAFT